MKTMESICVGQKKFRPALTSSSFYQPPLPHSRMATLRPQSEYGMSGIPWAGYSRGSSGSGSAEWPPWAGPGSRLTTSRPRKGRFCSLLLAGGALLALIAVLAVAGLALYMGAFRNDNPDPVIVFEGRLRIRKGIGAGVTAGFPGAVRMSSAIKQAYVGSSLGPALNSADVTAINDDKNIVFFRLYLDRRKIPSSIANLEETIKNVLIENSVLKNSPLRQLSVEPTSISIRRDSDHHPQSRANENSEVNSSPHPYLQQNTKEKILQTRMGVIRKPVVQSNLTNYKIKSPPTNDEPDVNFDELPVIQGSFQITKTEADITENKHKEHSKATNKPFIQKETTTTIKSETGKIKHSRPPMTPKRPVTSISVVESKSKTTTSAPTSKTTSKPSQKTTLATSIFIHNKAENSSQVKNDTSIKSKENTPEYLPKLDTLFAVPSYIDQEPWRPIKPGEVFSTINDTSSEFDPEERLGETELVDDISTLERFPSILYPMNLTDLYPPNNMSSQVFQSIPNIHPTENPPEPVYTSFTDPAFSSTYKEGQTFGVHYPKPHPIPVNKLVDEEVIKTKDAGEVSFDGFFIDSQTNVSSSDVKNSSRIPPKETMSTVAINVKPLIDDDGTEVINLNGGVIIKKQNYTNRDEANLSQSFVKLHTNSSSNEPTLFPSKWEYVNGSRNDSANSKKDPNKTFNETLQAVITENKEPEKVPFKYLSNEQKAKPALNLTSIINDLVSVLNNTHLEQSKKKLEPVESNTKKKEQYSFVAHGSSEPVDLKTQEFLMKQINEQSSTSTLLPSLLPVKSNSGIGRPLRPRPKVPSNQGTNGHDRSFSDINVFPFINQMKNFIQDLRSNSSSSTKNKTLDIVDLKQAVETTTKIYTTSVKTDIVTSVSYSTRTNHDNDNKLSQLEANKNLKGLMNINVVNNVTVSNGNNRNRTFFRDHVRDQTKKIDISEKFRLPKTHQSDPIEHKVNVSKGQNNFLDTIPTATEFFLTHPSTQVIALTEKVKMLLRDLEKDSEKSTSSPVVVSTENNKNHSNDFKFSDEEIFDIIKNISTNPSEKSITNHTLTDVISSEKLRHLASIATISDSHNMTFLNNQNAPDDTVISTKAVSSSYTINSDGFKILTKTFNKIPANFKDDIKKINKHDNSAQLLHDGIKSISQSEDCSNKNSTRCSNGQCLPETARCNRLLDCPNGEDELGCTCADYLRSQFLIRKLCDGVLDCWDFSDENNCEWCTPEQYVCSNSRQCINKEKVCDGQKDCPQGDDEKQCVTIAKSQEEAKAYPYSKEGYIMVQKHGKWGRLCIQNFEKVVARSQSSLQIADLGRAVCKTMTYIDYENVDRVIEDDKEKEHNYYSLYYTNKAEHSKGGLAFRRSGCSRGHVAKVVCSHLQCGARPQAASQQARIVGGGNAGAGAWPWQAALYKEGDFQCGATLISDRWLISAGHCFYHAQEDFWVARLGALRRGTSFPSPYEQLQPISSIILHPGYIDSGFINDIALLKTANRVAFSDYVRPICLPSFDTDIQDGRRCTVIGWGQLFEVGRIFPDTLQEVELPVISTSECRKRTLFLPLYRITDDMFCAGFDRGGRDACLGDSGGPLMCQEQDNQWYLYGVTSNGYGCARANRPGVYTKVSNYINWIQTTMQLYDDRSFDHLADYDQRLPNRSFIDLEVSESRSLHRHVDKCRGHRCPLGECLPPTRICNGFMECSDGSDEKDCK